MLSTHRHGFSFSNSHDEILLIPILYLVIYAWISLHATRNRRSCGVVMNTSSDNYLSFYHVSLCGGRQ